MKPNSRWACWALVLVAWPAPSAPAAALSLPGFPPGGQPVSTVTGVSSPPSIHGMEGWDFSGRPRRRPGHGFTGISFGAQERGTVGRIRVRAPWDTLAGRTRAAVPLIESGWLLRRPGRGPGEEKPPDGGGAPPPHPRTPVTVAAPQAPGVSVNLPASALVPLLVLFGGWAAVVASARLRDR